MAGTLVTGANSLEQLGGHHWLLDVAPWVTAGGAGTFVNGGWIGDDLEYVPTITEDAIKPGNALGKTLIFYTDYSLVINATFMQVGLRKLAVATGRQESDVLVATGVATLPLASPSPTPPNFQVRLKPFDAINLKPGYTEFPTDVYTVRTLTLWKCTITPRGAIPLGKKGMAFPVKIEAMIDGSVTESTSLGAFGKWVDSTT